MDCHECKENLLLSLDSVASASTQFEDHIKSCPSCAKEAAQLKESLRLVKDKEVFIPEVLETEKIERTEIELPQVIKNAVRQEYSVLQKEYKFRFAFPSLKFAYAMAIILCVGLGIYFVTFVANNYTLAPIAKITVNSPINSKEMPAEPSPVAPKKEDTGLLAVNKTNEKSAAALTPTPAKTAAVAPERKEPAKDILPAQKEIVMEKAAIPAPQDKTAAGAENKQSISAKSAYLPPASELVPAEINENLKKIVSEYNDVTFTAKKENSALTIFLTCPKEMKIETIEELKTMISDQIKIDKNKIMVTVK